MLQIDPITLGAIIGISGVVLGFVLNYIGDLIKEWRRRNQELDKVKRNLIIELTQNKDKIEEHLTILGTSEHRHFNIPPMNLDDKAWNIVRSSEIFHLIPTPYLFELAGIYYDTEQVNGIFDTDMRVNIESDENLIAERKNRLERLKQKIDNTFNDLQNLRV